ncbi:MAG: hypothetical protein ACYDGN_13700 [Acidimicrobiales bacterium]
MTVVSPSRYVNNGAPLVWQAAAGIRFDDDAGYAWRPVGRQGLGTTFGPVSPVSELLGPGFFGSIPTPPTTLSRQTLDQLRPTLLTWKVGDIVLVSGYSSARGRDPRITTALLGERPRHIAGCLVWTGAYEHVRACRGGYSELRLAGICVPHGYLNPCHPASSSSGAHWAPSAPPGLPKDFR